MSIIKKFLQNQFLVNLSRYLFSAGASQAIMMIYTIVVARSLGPEKFGQLSGSYALTGLTVFLVNLGMDTWMLHDTNCLAEPRRWAGKIIKNKILVGIGWGSLLTIIAPLIRPDIFTPFLMIVCSVDIWLDSAFSTQLGALNIQKRFRVISKLLFFSRAFRLFGAIIVLTSYRVNATPLAFAFTRSLATGVFFFVAWYLVKPSLTMKPLLEKSILTKSALFGFSEFLAMIYLQADLTLLSILAGKHDTGLYSPASSLVNALFIIPATVFNMVVPILVRQSTTIPQILNKSLQRLSVGFLGLGILMAFVIFGIGGEVLRLFLGDKFIISSIILKILSPLLIFKSLGFGWAAFLIAVGWQNRRLVPQAISAVINVLANLLFIPKYGIVGAALVYVVSEFILSLGYGALVIQWQTHTKKSLFNS